MTVTLITPSGNKVRTATQRRFVLIFEERKSDGRMLVGIEKRSDSLETLRTHVSRKGLRGCTVIMDTVTREVVR